MFKALLSILFCFTFLYSYAQTDPNNEDSIIKGNLSEVVVRAFEQNRRLQDVPAAVNYIGRSQLNRYNNITILPAVNSMPGVRMEERSPGSYRLNIRGSSLRSPFGVRNVKVYYNNIPLTDPGGHTYLNQLGFYNVQSLEIIKGPGSSLYGAGTGGVMLIENGSANNELQVNYSMGSYNLQNIHTSVGFGGGNVSNTISYQHQTSDGYREHTNMRRDMFSWNTSIKAGENSQLQTSFLYGDLFYQTPGALTISEYNQNPRSARPTVGFFPGSVATGAAIYQKTFVAGATYKQEFNKHLQNTTSLYGAFTQLRNPTTRNYGRSSEPHFGGRTLFQFKKEINENAVTLHAGAELQQGFTTLRIYSNKAGNPDTLQTDDELFNRQSFIFSQLSWQHKQWIITAGASLNQLAVEFTRLSNTPFTVQKRKYNNELAPRLAVLRKVGDDLSIYGSIAKGFSPPTSAELLPSGGTINTALNAEQGTNYEIGAKGSFLKQRLSYDVNAFYFRLNNTIVQRRDATGGDFFNNAGSTDQKGLETFINYRFNSPDKQFSDFSKVWISHTWNRFKYKEFKQLNNDFSGKELPSTAPHTVAAGLDIFTKAGAYLNLTYFYSDPIFLNDANTVKADSYNLVGSRFGFKTLFSSKYSVDIFGGVDNLFDVKYSLGNDINAFGNRYYNAAPNRNYYIGISLRALNKQ
jgi:iron complex outermembrane receptor protein